MILGLDPGLPVFGQGRQDFRFLTPRPPRWLALLPGNSRPIPPGRQPLGVITTERQHVQFPCLVPFQAKASKSRHQRRVVRQPAKSKLNCIDTMGYMPKGSSNRTGYQWQESVQLGRAENPPLAFPQGGEPYSSSGAEMCPAHVQIFYAKNVQKVSCHRPTH